MSPCAPQPKPNLLSLQKHIKRDWVRVYYASGIAWTLNQDIFHPVTSQDRAQFFTVNIQDGTERKLSLLHFLDFSFQSYNLCAIKPWLLYTSIVAMRLDILKLIFMSDGRSGSSKQVKLAKQRLVGQFCQWEQLLTKIGDEIFAWAGEHFTISWRTESECGHMWTWKFLNPQRKLADSKISWHEILLSRTREPNRAKRAFISLPHTALTTCLRT